MANDLNDCGFRMQNKCKYGVSHIFTVGNVNLIETHYVGFDVSYQNLCQLTDFFGHVEFLVLMNYRHVVIFTLKVR